MNQREGAMLSTLSTPGLILIASLICGTYQASSSHFQHSYSFNHHSNQHTSQGNCPSGLKGYSSYYDRGHVCYEFLVHQRDRYSEAKEYCASHGGTLATVNSADISNYLITILTNQIHGTRQMWIGLEKPKGGALFRWPDGTTPLAGGYNYYWSGFKGANQGTENCVAFDPSDGGKWYSYNCHTTQGSNFSDDEMGFICEYGHAKITTTNVPATHAAVPTNPSIVSNYQHQIHGQWTTNNVCQSWLPGHTYSYGNTCYQFVLNQRVNFYEAKLSCETYGGTLALVKNVADSNFLNNVLLIHEHDRHRVWIGIQRVSHSHHYYYLDGTPVTSSFDMMAPNQQYTADAHCMSMDPGSGGWWYSYPCHLSSDNNHDEMKGYICQYIGGPHTQAPTQAHTQALTKAPTQAPTQALTQVPTQAPTQAPTQVPTQAPTHAPTQTPTLAPTHLPATFQVNVDLNDVDNCPVGIPRDRYLYAHKGICYHLMLSHPTDYNTAKHRCESIGGMLVLLKSQETTDFVVNILRKLNHYYYTWIGLEDTNYEGHYYWEDGESVKENGFINWGRYQGPYGNSHNSQDCIALSVQDHGKWYDLACNSQTQGFNNHGFICQHNFVNPMTTQIYSVTKAPTSSTHLSSTVNCPLGLPRDQYLHAHGGFCYHFMMNHLTDYATAKESCESRNGMLVLVKSNETTDFLVNILKIQLHHDSRVWIGMHDQYLESVYYWEDGMPVSQSGFLNWGKNQGPHDSDHNGEDCITLDPSEDGTWYDRPCNCRSYAYICQHEMIRPSPVPNGIGIPNNILNDINNCPLELPKNQYLKAHNGFCYHFWINHHISYQSAKDNCKSRHGNLVVVKSLEMNNFLLNILRQYHSSNPVWIGLDDSYLENTYYWANGQSLAETGYTNWGTEQGQKDHGNTHISQDCVALDPSDHGKWYDKPCGTQNYWKLGFICQHQMILPTTAQVSTTTTTRTTLKPQETTTTTTKSIPTTTSTTTTTTTPTTTSTTQPASITTPASTTTKATATTTIAQKTTMSTQKIITTSHKPRTITPTTSITTGIHTTTTTIKSGLPAITTTRRSGLPPLNPQKFSMAIPTITTVSPPPAPIKTTTKPTTTTPTSTTTSTTSTTTTAPTTTTTRRTTTPTTTTTATTQPTTTTTPTTTTSTTTTPTTTTTKSTTTPTTTTTTSTTTSTSTTATPTTTTTTTTTPKSTRPTTTTTASCAPFNCLFSCGRQGYQVDANGCMHCACNGD